MIFGTEDVHDPKGSPKNWGVQKHEFPKIFWPLDKDQVLCVDGKRGSQKPIALVKSHQIPVLWANEPFRYHIVGLHVCAMSGHFEEPPQISQDLGCDIKCNSNPGEDLRSKSAIRLPAEKLYSAIVTRWTEN